MTNMALSNVIEQIWNILKFFDLFDHFGPTFGACISQDSGCRPISVPIANVAFSDVIEQIWTI